MNELSLHEYCEQIDNTIEQGRYAEAVAHGKHILKQYPKHVDTYRLLGKAMLEAGQDEYAIDMFRRVLSADPEDMIAWVGLSEVHNKHDELDAATWYLERAFELTTDNKAIEEELRQLYSRRDGVELHKTPLTAGALARLYLKGDLLSRAINDFRTLLDEHPERVDLRVALAEALWRNEQRLEAAEACQWVLDDLPCCLKANLILGSIWIKSGREEGQTYLRMAEAMDPENRMAQELFGDASPLPAREVRTVPLEYRPQTGEKRPDWMIQVEEASAEGPPLTDKESMLVDITAALEAQIEIPSWLENISIIDGELPPSAPPSPDESQVPTTEEAISAPVEQVPDWLMTSAGRETMEEQSEEMAEIEEETPEWLTGLGLEPIGEEVEVEVEEDDGKGTPEWLAEFGVDVTEEEPFTPDKEREGETPEWLADLGVRAGDEAPAPAASTIEPPDWLSDLREQFGEEEPVLEEKPATAEPVPADVPDWLQELAPPEPTDVPVMEETPAWLESDQVPSGDEALAWLEQLAEGKEEELQAQIKAEAEIRMAEIMGRPTPAPEIAPEEPAPEVVPAEIPDWLQELAPPEVAAPAAAIEAAPEPVAPPAEEAFGWTEFGEPEVQPEAAPAAEEMPAWLESDQVPSGDEALAWLEQLAEGKEEELQAQIKAESEVRMAEIMGRPTPAPEIAPEETVPAPPEIEAELEEALAPQFEEMFGWTGFGGPEAQPDVIPTIPPAVEEALPPEEMVPILAAEEVEVAVQPPEEAIAPPPPVPTIEAPAGLFAEERAYLKANPRDYDAWLALAQSLWQANEREESLEAYARVIRSGKLVEAVIADLEEYLEHWPDVRVLQALGDAYMKDGQLQKALDLYRQALEKL